jgi:hypothetical protein
LTAPQEGLASAIIGEIKTASATWPNATHNTDKHVALSYTYAGCWQMSAIIGEIKTASATWPNAIHDTDKHDPLSYTYAGCWQMVCRSLQEC